MNNLMSAQINTGFGVNNLFNTGVRNQPQIVNNSNNNTGKY